MPGVEVPGCGGAEEGAVVLGDYEWEGTGAPCLRNGGFELESKGWNGRVVRFEKVRKVVHCVGELQPHFSKAEQSR